MFFSERSTSCGRWFIHEESGFAAFVCSPSGRVHLFCGMPDSTPEDDQGYILIADVAEFIRVLKRLQDRSHGNAPADGTRDDTAAER